MPIATTAETPPPPAPEIYCSHAFVFHCYTSHERWYRCTKCQVLAPDVFTVDGLAERARSQAAAPAIP